MYRIFYIRADKLVESINRFKTFDEAVNHCEMLKANSFITRMWIKDIYGNIKKIL